MATDLVSILNNLLWFFIVIIFILITVFFSYLILNSGNILHNFDFIKERNCLIWNTK